MDLNTVHQIFANTMHADVTIRQQAEAQLNQLDNQPKMLELVLHLVSFNETQPDVKIAAALYFKNKVRKAWDPYLENEVVPISQEDRIFIRSRILEVMSESTEVIRLALTTAINSILLKDYPYEWVEFLPNVSLMLQSDKLNLAYSGLLALHELFRVIQWKSFKKETHLLTLIDTVFPQLNSLAVGLVSQDSPEAALMLCLCLKIYRKGIRTSLPKSQQAPATLIAWGNLFIQVIEKGIPTENLPEEVSDREALPWVKARKWGYHCINTLFERYGNPSSLAKTSKYYKFALKFVKHFGPNIFQAYLHQVELHISGTVWLSRKCTFLSSVFFGECISHKQMWQLFEPHVEKIITQFIFPQLCYTSEDEEQLEDNPSEFLNRRLNNTLDSIIDTEAANELLVKLIDVRGIKIFDGLMAFALSVLQRHAGTSTPQTDREKDGALAMVECIASPVLDSDQEVHNKMAFFFNQFVFAELTNPNPLLSFRACSLVRVYADLAFDAESIDRAFHGVLALLNCKHLAIQAGAALALEGLVPYETIIPTVLPLLPQLIEKLLLLTNQMDLENLAKVLEKFVETFPAELAPYSLQLCESLVSTFYRLTEEITRAPEEGNEDQYDENSEKIFTAIGVLKTLGTLVITLEDKPEIVLQLETRVLPAVRYIFEKDIDDLYDDVFELIDCCLYSLKAVTPAMWGIIEMVFAKAIHPERLYFSEYCTTLDNVAEFGIELIAKDASIQQKFYEIFHSVMVANDSELMDQVRACKLITNLLIHLKNTPSPLIAPTLGLIMPSIVANTEYKSQSLYTQVLKLVIACIFCDQGSALMALEQNSWTSSFLKFWFKHIDLLNNIQEIKLGIIVLCDLLGLPTDSLPNSIIQHFREFLVALIFLFQKYPDALLKYDDAVKRAEKLDDGIEEAEETDEDQASDEDVEADADSEGLDDATSVSTDTYTDSEFSVDDYLDSDLMRTPIGKFNVFFGFQDLFRSLEARDSASFFAIISQLEPEQQEAIKKILAEADHQRANPTQAQLSQTPSK